jgi:hypothetical protein
VARVGEMTHKLMFDWHNWLSLMWDSLSGLQRWTMGGFNMFLHVLTNPPKRSYLNQSYPKYEWLKKHKYLNPTTRFHELPHYPPPYYPTKILRIWPFVDSLLVY